MIRFIIILETLGTGHTAPFAPASLADYYATLENEYGFQRRAIRTDYRFDSPQSAEQLTRFFFGDALADRVVADGSVNVPECTGVWWRHL